MAPDPFAARRAEWQGAALPSSQCDVTRVTDVTADESASADALLPRPGDVTSAAIADVTGVTPAASARFRLPVTRVTRADPRRAWSGWRFEPRRGGGTRVSVRHSCPPGRFQPPHRPNHAYARRSPGRQIASSIEQARRSGSV
jgi:hypothetical protein